MNTKGPIANVNYDSLKAYQGYEHPVLVTATYVGKYIDDYILVDSTLGAVSITLPLCKGNGLIFSVIRVAGANNVTVLPTGSDTINGAASVVITTSYTPYKFKDFTPLITGYARIG